ncbi:MAG: protein kinase, partial [Deltaproteobacteria bacterium]|nr:protein kinase [Nannocystaceae bacterium]
DFKPANVLVGDDGRVRVVDFGLARTLEPEETGEHAHDDDTDDGGLAAVTQQGVVVGTPMYMAPEQFTGAPADARSDQFAFCVSMFEALYGRAPFEGADMRAQLAAKRAGRVVTPSPSVPVPGTLHAVILRGLAADPALRFPAMPDLLRGLLAAPNHTLSLAHRVGRFVALALALASIIAAVLVLATRTATPTGCAAPAVDSAGRME